LVNNAGAGAILPLEAATSMASTEIFAVNVFGPSLLVTAALPYLKVSGGNTVNISSTFGHKAASALSHYAASKAALEHMTRCWALELADQRIRVNAVAAGPTETDFLTERTALSDEQAESVKAQERSRIPLGRRGLPEEVATWIVALASDAAGWITGQVITVDGGLSIT
jgi:NAD(P)-dependent dehydrogenase (short-subunit alcohol dehydrogenase family)